MNANTTTPYGMSVTVAMDQARALDRAREELAREGFGILAEMDIAATLKKKLDVDFPPYMILGACNPPLALKALQAEPDIGLLLPCNVVVRAAEDGGTVVAAMEPVAALSLTGNDKIRPIADDVRARLQRVLDAVAATGRT